GRLLITEARSSSPTIPSPVAISVTNVRSDGTSPVGVTVQRVIPEPLLVTRVEQRDEIEDRAARPHEDVQRGVASATACWCVRREEDERKISTALVQHGGLAQRLPERVRSPETGTARGERAGNI